MVTIEERRNRADLVEVYKMINGQSAIPAVNFFEFNTDRRTRGHQFKLKKRQLAKDIRLHFFSERVTQLIQSRTSTNARHSDRLLHGRVVPQVVRSLFFRQGVAAPGELPGELLTLNAQKQYEIETMTHGYYRPLIESDM